ncbi:hypothetical protein NP493_506g02075 [Ridgeia piscesae]|uniref:Uncharacterized protein n=1 Tax=Ridgeia piscesae TaxID=27915 RepID=A0AAD9NR11_RIDPI|nr:hypothetical protein NP493_506g02075 [Ridgeia piscesae]
MSMGHFSLTSRARRHYTDARETQCPQTVSVIWKLTPMVIVTSEPQRQSVGPKKNCTN